MQNFGVTNKEHYGMLWYFMEWSIGKTKKNKNVAVLKTFKLYKNILRMVETAFALGDV